VNSFLDPAFQQAMLYMYGGLGSTAISLFALPHADFSQPRNVIGGVAISATIGVACYQFLAGSMTIYQSINVFLNNIYSIQYSSI
jgi:CBS-domain-containing membrane protein